MELPEIELINMQSETQQNNVVTHFSRKLLAAMEEAVAGKEQVILFQNRRDMPRMLSVLRVDGRLCV